MEEMNLKKSTPASCDVPGCDNQDTEEVILSGTLKLNLCGSCRRELSKSNSAELTQHFGPAEFK